MTFKIPTEVLCKQLAVIKKTNKRLENTQDTKAKIYQTKLYNQVIEKRESLNKIKEKTRAEKIEYAEIIKLIIKKENQRRYKNI